MFTQNPITRQRALTVSRNFKGIKQDRKSEGRASS